MKVTLILIATSFITGCTYSPKDDHSKHNNTNYYYGETSSNKRQNKDEGFVQYKQNNNNPNLSSGAPFYDEGLKPRETYHHPTAAYDRATVVHSSQYIPYTPIPYIAAIPNRSVYYIERGF